MSCCRSCKSWAPDCKECHIYSGWDGSCTCGDIGEYLLVSHTSQWASAPSSSMVTLVPRDVPDVEDLSAVNFMDGWNNNMTPKGLRIDAQPTVPDTNPKGDLLNTCTLNQILLRSSRALLKVLKNCHCKAMSSLTEEIATLRARLQERQDQCKHE